MRASVTNRALPAVACIFLLSGIFYAGYNSSLAATFYRALCTYEQKELGNWHHDRTVAENSGKNHETNTGHSYKLIYK